jgi:predicted deacylase
MVSGQVILLPMANFPAAQAGNRTSPLDEGNLNRSFPGDPMGSPTALIAHYLETVLFPRAQVIVDLHSGGSSLLYEGCNMLALEPRDDEEAARLTRLLKAMGLPRALLHAPNPKTISSAARRQGAISIVTELAGAGTITGSALQMAQQSVLHLLGHLGVVRGEIVPDSAPSQPRFMRIDGDRHFVYANCDGLFEPLVELGERVEAGQAAARIHFPDNPLREPELIFFEGSGVVVCKRMPALSRHGDCLFQLAEDVLPPARD